MDDVYYKKYPSSSRDHHTRHQAAGVGAGGHHPIGMGPVFAGSATLMNQNSNRSGRSLMQSDPPLMGTSATLDYGHGSNSCGAAVGGSHHDYDSSSSAMVVDHRSIFGGPSTSSTQPPPMDIPLNVNISTASQNYFDSRIGDSHASTTTTVMSSSAASATSSTALEKYFTQTELKRFNEFNRFLVMSSPERQKKFYSSLSSVEYKRFSDYLDMESQAKSVPPPPPLPKVPTASSISQGHQQSVPDSYSSQPQQPKPAYTIQSSYSYDTSYYGNGSNENIANSTMNNNYHQRNTGKFNSSLSQVTSDYYGRSSTVDGSADCYQPPLPQIHNDTYNQDYIDHQYNDGYEDNQMYGTYSSTYGSSYHQNEMTTDRYHRSNKTSAASRSRSRTPNR